MASKRKVVAKVPKGKLEWKIEEMSYIPPDEADKSLAFITLDKNGVVEIHSAFDGNTVLFHPQTAIDVGEAMIAAGKAGLLKWSGRK